MQVSESELRSMLVEAYERGWAGFLEGGEQCVSEIVAGFRLRTESDTYSSITTTTESPSYISNASDPYYFYSSMTLPPPQNSGRRDIV